MARVATVSGVVGISVAFAGLMMARCVIYVVAEDNLEAREPGRRTLVA